MFFYRDPEEVEKEAADALAAKIAAAEGSAEAVAEPAAGDWDASLPAISAQPAESPSHSSFLLPSSPCSLRSPDVRHVLTLLPSFSPASFLLLASLAVSPDLDWSAENTDWAADAPAGNWDAAPAAPETPAA